MREADGAGQSVGDVFVHDRFVHPKKNLHHFLNLLFRSAPLAGNCLFYFQGSKFVEIDTRFRRRIWRIIAASGMMGGVLWTAMVVMTPLFGMIGLRYIALLVLVSLGIVSYFGLGHLIGAFRLSEFRGAMRRGG